MRQWLLVSLLVCASAQAQYKCVGQGGAISFQQMPCAPSAKAQALQLREIRPSGIGEPPSGSPASDGRRKLLPDEVILLRMQRERRLREIGQEIENLEADLSWRADAMERELGALRTRRQSAMNNLAGATWEQSIATEMLAVTQKHKALSDNANERLKVLRSERAALNP